MVVFTVLFGFVSDGRLVSCTLDRSVDLQVTGGSIQQDTPSLITCNSEEQKLKEREWKYCNLRNRDIEVTESVKVNSKIISGIC